MKRIYLGMIIVIVLTLTGCGKAAIQQRNYPSGNPTVSPTSAESVVTPNDVNDPSSNPTVSTATFESVVTPTIVKYYSDENHKIFNTGKLSITFNIFHIVQETFNGSDYTIGYKEDQSISGNDNPVENMIIREMKDLKLLDKESIKSFLIKMMPNYENIRIYNNITDDSGITYLAVISGCGKSYYITNYGDTSYLIDSDLDFVEDYIFDTVLNKENYEEIKENVECANSFSASIHEIIDCGTKTVKYEIIQGKNGKKYSAEVNNFDEFERSTFILKKDNEETMLNITLTEGWPGNVITFIDVNLDGYVDIQALDEPIGNESTYNLYVWEESSNNFVKVKCDTEISNFEVYDGYLIDWVSSSELIWKDNKTLVKKSEEEYHADDSSVSDTN